MCSKYDSRTPTGGGGSSPLLASKLFDLVKFRWNINLKCFVKSDTLLTNVPKSIAYAKKKSFEFHNSINKVHHVVYQVCPNGTYQYQNKLLIQKSKNNGSSIICS